MNRRDLLKRAFAIGAGGLLLPALEPTRRVWALDRTMIRSGAINRTGPDVWPGKVVIGDFGPGSNGGPVGRPGKFQSGYVYDEASFTNVIDLPTTLSPDHSITIDVGYYEREIIHVRAVSATEWVVESIGDSDQFPYPMSICDAMRFFND